MVVHVGCCGWQYDDWIGPFYPPEKRGRKSEWLEYYGRFFDSAEIDSSFYAVPGRQTVEAWLRKGRRIGDFEFTVKMHQEVTHARLVEGNAAGALEKARGFEKNICAPLEDGHLLGAVLLQLSPYFQRVDGSLRSRMPALKELLGGLETDRYRYVVEFRHKSWLDMERKEVHSEALEALRDRRVAVCVMDSPGFPATHAQTADHAYVRFHGRNYDLWYAKEKPEGDIRINRYDYLYTEEELNPWVEEVENIEQRCREVRIAFNNHGHAKAVRNALMFRKMLGLDPGKKQTKIPEPMTLDRFG